MSRKVKSMRGETIDFDLIDIKNQIMAAPTPDTVQQRERFIDRKRRRGTRRRVDEMVAAQKYDAEAAALIERQKQQQQEELAAIPHTDIGETVVQSGRPRKIVKGAE